MRLLARHRALLALLLHVLHNDLHRLVQLGGRAELHELGVQRSRLLLPQRRRTAQKITATIRAITSAPREIRGRMAERRRRPS
jgi:hypothetical protein